MSKVIIIVLVLVAAFLYLRFRRTYRHAQRGGRAEAIEKRLAALRKKRDEE